MKIGSIHRFKAQRKDHLRAWLTLLSQTTAPPSKRIMFDCIWFCGLSLAYLAGTNVNLWISESRRETVFFPCVFRRIDITVSRQWRQPQVKRMITVNRFSALLSHCEWLFQWIPSLIQSAAAWKWLHIYPCSLTLILQLNLICKRLRIHC